MMDPFSQKLRHLQEEWFSTTKGAKFAKEDSQANSPALQKLFAGFAPFVVFQNPLGNGSCEV